VYDLRVSLEVKLVGRLADVEREEWDALVGPEGSPFLEWDWLASLEEAGCVGRATGWVAHHLTVRDGERLIAAVPLYLKAHSQGEFVFDHAWAEAAQQAGIDYYPKLLAAVPFTPAAGRRLLTRPDLPRPPLLGVLARSLRDICSGNEISSLHVNFCCSDEVEALAAAGFLPRHGLQFHWRNDGYRSFDDYLSSLRSKRRNQVRRERREIGAAGIRIETHEGEAIPDDLFRPMFRIYLSTVEKMYWGRRYLNPAFFELLRQRWKRNLCFVVARRGDQLLAGTINAQKAGIFYGRYWGCFEEVRHLHFEVCYYAGIEHCIRRGLRSFEPGAGGEFKYWRGFEPTITHSMHYLPHRGLARAVARFLERERAYVEATADEMRKKSPGSDDAPPA
jgi:predicted N-acyltransferase